MLRFPYSILVEHSQTKIKGPKCKEILGACHVNSEQHLDWVDSQKHGRNLWLVLQMGREKVALFSIQAERLRVGVVDAVLGIDRVGKVLLNFYV